MNAPKPDQTSPASSLAAPRGKLGWAFCAIGFLVVANLFGLFATRWIPRGSRGWIEYRDLVMTGISFGHVGLAIFVISFGHWRAPLRQLLCSLFVMLTVFMLPLNHYFKDGGVSGLLQIYYLAVLWFGYLGLIAVRLIGRFEFGFVQDGSFLPARPFQFQIRSMAVMAGIVAIPFGLMRLLISIYATVPFVSRDLSSLIFFPLMLITGLLLATIPFLFSILKREGVWLWSFAGIVWGAAPALLAWNYVNPQIVTVYEMFWATMVANMLLIRLMGFRWLPVAVSALAIEAASPVVPPQQRGLPV